MASESLGWVSCKNTQWAFCLLHNKNTRFHFTLSFEPLAINNIKDILVFGENIKVKPKKRTPDGELSAVLNCWHWISHLAGHLCLSDFCMFILNYGAFTWSGRFSVSSVGATPYRCHVHFTPAPTKQCLFFVASCRIELFGFVFLSGHGHFNCVVNSVGDSCRLIYC